MVLFFFLELWRVASPVWVDPMDQLIHLYYGRVGPDENRTFESRCHVVLHVSLFSFLFFRYPMLSLFSSLLLSSSSSFSHSFILLLWQSWAASAFLDVFLSFEKKLRCEGEKSVHLPSSLSSSSSSYSYSFLLLFVTGEEEMRILSLTLNRLEEEETKKWNEDVKEVKKRFMKENRKRDWGAEKRRQGWDRREISFFLNNP